MGLAHPPELDDPVPPVAVVEMFERNQAPLLAPREQYRQAQVFLAGPQLLPHAILHVAPRHGVIADGIDLFGLGVVGELMRRFDIHPDFLIVAVLVFITSMALTVVLFSETVRRRL